MNTLCIVFMLLVVTTVAQNNSPDVCTRSRELSQLLCLHEDSTINTRTIQGPPGKKGIRGSKGGIGPRGVAGERGPSGVVNYENVEEMIDEKLIPGNQKVDQSSRTIEEMQRKIETIERNAEVCELRFENKCFWVDEQISQVNYAKGEEICAKHGGHLANIYSNEHCQIVLAYLRSKILRSIDIYPWIGMKYNPSTKTITLHDGAPGPKVADLVWYTGYPTTIGSYTVMGIVASTNTMDPQSGVHNYPTTSTRSGAFCEITI